MVEVQNMQDFMGRFSESQVLLQDAPCVQSWQYGESHVWKRMVEARENMEKEIEWRLGKGELSFWWDNWNGKGAITTRHNIRGKTKSKDLVKDFWLGNRWKEESLQEPVRRDIRGLSLRQNVEDTPIWLPDKSCGFSLASAKKLAREQNTVSSARLFWYAKIWQKYVPWKASFLAWRVFKRKLPTDDRLRAFGYQLASRCYYCAQPEAESLSHVFCEGETARRVWQYFAGSLGLLLQIRSVSQICYDWWRKRHRNRLVKYMADRLPVLILLELWAHMNQCKHGNEKVSGSRIIFKVSKGIADCVKRKWPSWDPFPPNWIYILRKAQGFGCTRIVRSVFWNKPPLGWLKINLVWNREGCGFIIRNSQGEFMLAGIHADLGQALGSC
ncbi:PREDICTED: uncharacterized protein LOC109191256 [Ipomoea nil]|uniref:uncharacterized protein LOC109191256 n=1 Tax=Ipomoea nil TaxID=35883 RepID=UPI000900BB32|nr:PREDICTED: uncharacterized protein LOC109191256 [Ipomoea nil]